MSIRYLTLPTASQRLQHGATLIEVLVSLLILAIGMLGMAGLQTVSLRNTQSALLRTQATLMSSDVVERMRANLQGFEAGNYNNNAGELAPSCISVVGCSPADMAGHDVAEWKAALADNLPAGAGVVCVDATLNDGTAATPACDGVGTVYGVKIWWDEDRDGQAEKLFAMSFQP